MKSCRVLAAASMASIVLVVAAAVVATMFGVREARERREIVSCTPS